MRTTRTPKRFDIVDFMPLILAATAIIVIVSVTALLIPEKVKSIADSELKALPFEKGTVYKTLGNGIVYIDSEKGNLYYLDDRNEVMWGYSGTDADMKLYTCDTRVGIAEGKKLQVINKDGQHVFSKEFDRNIFDVAMGDKLIAVSLSRSDDTIILNSTGEEIDRITSNSNCTNIRFGVYSGGSVWVITVENSGYSPEFRLSTYKYDTGKTQTVTFEDDSQMMYDAAFDDKLCYIFGTERIMVRDCDYTGTVNYDYNVNGYDVTSIGMLDKKMHILLLNNGYLKAINGRKVSDMQCSEKILYAYVSEKHYYAFSKYFMYRFDPDSGKNAKYRFPVRIDGFEQGKDFAVIESCGTLYRYGIPA